MDVITAEQAQQQALAVWNLAAQQQHQWLTCREQNPHAGWEAERQWEIANGIPALGRPGRMTFHGFGAGGWPYVKLPHPTAWGSYVIRCKACDGLCLKHHVAEGGGTCHDCRATVLEQRKARQAEQRIIRRRKRSQELANRRGLCRVCGTEITVARGTRTTCSERCRKQWLRKGAEAFPLPPAPSTYLVGQVELPLEQAHETLFRQLEGRLLANSRQAVSTGQWPEDPTGDQLRQALDQVIHLRTLPRLREEAPAVFLWEVSQQGGLGDPGPPPEAGGSSSHPVDPCGATAPASSTPVVITPHQDQQINADNIRLETPNNAPGVPSEGQDFKANNVPLEPCGAELPDSPPTPSNDPSPAHDSVLPQGGVVDPLQAESLTEACQLAHQLGWPKGMGSAIAARFNVSKQAVGQRKQKLAKG